MTTITVVCPPTSSMAFLESGSDLDTGLVPVTLPTIDSINRTRSTKKPRNLKGRFRGLGVCLESREGSGRHAVLSPETCYGPGKRPGPPPAAVEGQTMKSRRRVTGHRRPLLHRAIRCKKLTRDQSDRTRILEESGPVEPNRKVMVKYAAARQATRRLPLGEPPLVITTHAITSFRSSHPDPAGVQPRAISGSSPSCHGSTTRKSTERVFGSERHIEFSQQAILDQQATAAKQKRGRKTPFAPSLSVTILSSEVSQISTFPKFMEELIMPFKRAQVPSQREILSLAEDWGKVVARRAFGDERPDLDLNFDAIEAVAFQAAQAVIKGTIQQSLSQQMRKLGETQSCPQCRRVCRVETEPRELI